MKDFVTALPDPVHFPTTVEGARGGGGSPHILSQKISQKKKTKLKNKNPGKATVFTKGKG